MYCFFSHHKTSARNTTQNCVNFKVFTLVCISCVFWDVIQHNWLFSSQCCKSALWSLLDHDTTALPQNVRNQLHSNTVSHPNDCEIWHFKTWWHCLGNPLKYVANFLRQLSEPAKESVWPAGQKM